MYQPHVQKCITSLILVPTTAPQGRSHHPWVTDEVTQGKGAGNWAWPRFEHPSLVPKTSPFPQEPRTPQGKAWVTRSRGDPSLSLPRGCCGFSAVGTWKGRVRHVQAGGEGPREVAGHLASGHHQKDAEQAGRLTPSWGSVGRSSSRMERAGPGEGTRTRFW